MHTFRSDNNAGICEEAVQAIVDANNGGHVVGYGDDEYTAEAQRCFADLFGDDTAVYFVGTGTAANTLAIASIAEPWQRILCHAHSHLNDDESTAPERLTHMRVTPVETDISTSKLSPDDIERHGRNSRGDVHQPAPGVLTISNPTEFGEVYTAPEVSALCEVAHAHGYRVHVDGARFANAVASLDCDPRAIANHAGVDALSFGGTKNGLAFGEAVLFFPQGDRTAYERAIATFEFHRKGAGHLLSKHRFISAPFARTLQDDIWLKHARHANQMARILSGQLQEAGVEVRYATDANAVFVAFSEELNRGLFDRGHEYYMFGDATWGLARLMCSFDTQESQIEGFINDVRELA